jgi:glycine/sarcosine N-methyltransferase
MKFYSSIADVYDYIFPYNPMHKNYILSCVKQSESKELLDIGCGTGNLSIEVAKSFKKVTSIDLDNEMISKAGSKAEDFDNLNFECMNMLNIRSKFGENAFDGVFSFGNTIVHLNSLDEIDNFFSQVRSVLEVSGKFLFQIINYDRILQKKIENLSTIDNENIKFERYYNYLESKNYIEFINKLTIKKTGKIIDNAVILYPLRQKEICDLLRKNGFKQIKLYSNFKKEKLTSDSVPLIVEAD